MCFYKANSDLAVIWAVGQKMWQRDFPGTYENLKKDWSDGLRPIMDAILGNIFCFIALLLWPPYGIGQAIIFLLCGFFLSFFSSPNLSGRRSDVYHTPTRGVALVRI